MNGPHGVVGGGTLAGTYEPEVTAALFRAAGPGLASCKSNMMPRPACRLADRRSRLF